MEQDSRLQGWMRCAVVSKTSHLMRVRDSSYSLLRGDLFTSFFAVCSSLLAHVMFV